MYTLGTKKWWDDSPLNGMEAVLREHVMTDESVGGFLALCHCGAAVDSSTEHWADMLAEAGFGDLKPARKLVEDWRLRAQEISDKALWMSEAGSTKFSTQYRMIRASAYRFLSSKLKEALDEEE